MKIFCGEKEINYNTPDRYAYLNWRFDNSLGQNDKNNPCQSISDNYEMGKAYMANAVLALYSILYTKNYCNTADSLIFPILFDVCHGIELWLKSSLKALRLLGNKDSSFENHHKIDDYMDMLVKELQSLGMRKTEEISLAEVKILIGELKRVGAHFDFARYSFDRYTNYQFYNAPYGDERQWQKNRKEDKKRLKTVVPNTCVDLEALFEITVGITVNFRNLVEFLTMVITEEELTDDRFSAHVEVGEKSMLYDKERAEESKDSMQEIIEFICKYIL